MTVGACRDYALKYQLSDWTVFSATIPLQMASVKVAEATPERQPGPPNRTAGCRKRRLSGTRSTDC